MQAYSFAKKKIIYQILDFFSLSKIKPPLKYIE